MRTSSPLLLLLVLGLCAPPSAHALQVCGTARAADGSALPEAARAELLPIERAYAWELRVMDGKQDSEPAAAAQIARGRFCLTAPEPGLWRVVVGAPGFVATSRFPVAVTAPLELPPTWLPRDEGLRVNVTTAGGPAAGAWVIATSADRDFWSALAGEGWRPALRFARVGDGGRARLPRAPGETVDLVALTAGSVTRASSRAGDEPGAVELSLPRLASPRAIVVRDESGRALPRVTVSLADEGWPVGVTDEGGRLTLLTAPGAAVPLVLEAEDGRRRVVRLPAAPELAAPRERSSSVTFVVPPTPAVRGRVVDGRQGAALAGAVVWLGPDPGTHVVTGPDGELTLPGGGRSRIRLEADAAEHLPRGLTMTEAELAAGEVQRIALQPAAAAIGRVVDAEGAPVEGVSLAARPEAAEAGTEETEAVSRARSATDGRFRIPGLRPAVAYRVTAQREGFVTRTLPGVVLPPPHRSADLGTLVLRPGTRLQGLAVDGRGRPVAGAEVRVRPAGDMPTPAAAERLRRAPPDAVAGPDGRFVVPDLPAGRPLDLLASRQGYLPAWTLAVEVPAPEPLTVVLADASRLSGSLVDQDGLPVPGAAVGLRWARPPAGTVGLEPLRPESRSTQTDERGEFTFGELTPGEVRVYARPPGFLPGESGTLTLPAAGEVAGVRLVLARGAVVEGRIFGPDGDPVEAAQLRIDGARTLSGPEGAFQLAGVPPGERALHAFHPDYRRLVRELHVLPGANPVDLYLEDGWSVSGRALDEAGQAVAGARLELRADRPDAVTGYWTTSDDDGRFRMVVSEEGTFRLLASHEDFSPAEVGDLEVRAPSVDGIEVRLARGGSVVGRVLGLDPDELAGVTVAARREDGLGAQASVAGRVDPQGRYAVDHLAPGAWRIQAQLAGDRRAAGATVILDSGDREVSRDLEFGTGLRLGGQLLHGGEPVPGAHVLLSGLTATGERSVLSGHDGTFRIEDLAPGRYRLDVLDRSRALSFVEDLELRTDRDLLLELESAPLVGTVSEAEGGEPVADALVTVRRVLAAAGEAGPLIAVGTDATGGFVIAHLTPGDYLVSASKEGYAPAEQPLRIEAGAAPAPARLRLARTGGITLTLHLASGAVPGNATVSAFDGAGHLVSTATRSVTARGFAHFGQVPAGEWRLLVSAPGAAATWVTARVPESSPEVVLPPAAPLVVRVPDLMESNGAGTLSVALPGGEPFFQVDLAGEVRTRWPVAGGLVTLADLPAGVWSLRVDGAQGGAWTGSVVTDGRAPSAVDLE